MWDKAAARRYERWYETVEGSFALALEDRMIRRMISDWPRRGQKFLEIGCGTGLFLHIFWEAGFEAHGMDSSPQMLAIARRRLEDNAELQVGQAEHLPYEENEFDFAALLTVLEFTENPRAVLAEAARVARKGLLITFLNRFSLYYLTHGRAWPWTHEGTLKRAHWYTCREMRAMVQEVVGGQPMRMASVLPGPLSTWRPSPPWRWINGLVLPGGFGSYCGLRVDLLPGAPLTPIYAYKTETRPSA